MKWNTENLPLKKLASGEQISITIHTLVGNPGPHIHILGHTLCSELMEVIKNKYSKINGSISFIPRPNPIKEQNRNHAYVDIIKETNFDIETFCLEHLDLPWHELKIVFKEQLSALIDYYMEGLQNEQAVSIQIKNNLILQSLASKSDGVINLNSDDVPSPYLYAAEYQEAITKYLSVSHIVTLPHHYTGSLDNACFMPWVYLMETLKEMGRYTIPDVEAFTFELGRDLDQLEGILNYLKYKGVIEEQPKQFESHYCKYEDLKSIFSSEAGAVDYNVTAGDHIKTGDVLASIGSEHQVKTHNDGIVLNTCHKDIVNEGTELFQLMTKVYKK